MATIKDFLQKNQGKLYAALPSKMVDGKKVAARYLIGDILEISDTTVYTILSGKGQTFASDETHEKVVAEAIRLLKSTDALVQEYEQFSESMPTV